MLYRLIENDQKSIRLNPIQTDLLILINSNESEVEVIPSESEIFRNMFSKHSESFRTNPKTFYDSFDEKTIKNQSNLMRRKTNF